MNDNTTATTASDCRTCYDTEVIDQGGREIPCPACQRVSIVTIKITGLGHGLGHYADSYATAVAHTGSSITFSAPSRAIILADVNRVRASAIAQVGHRGRDSRSSWAIAIATKVATTTTTEETQP
jgi:hypothetical protein